MPVVLDAWETSLRWLKRKFDPKEPCVFLSYEKRGRQIHGCRRGADVGSFLERAPCCVFSLSSCFLCFFRSNIWKMWNGGVLERCQLVPWIQRKQHCFLLEGFYFHYYRKSAGMSRDAFFGHIDLFVHLGVFIGGLDLKSGDPMNPCEKHIWIPKHCRQTTTYLLVPDCIDSMWKLWNSPFQDEQYR